MALTGESLESLMAKTPRFSTRKREVHLNSNRAQVMMELAQEHNLSLLGDGLRIRTGNGWVYLVPLTRRPSLRIVAESPDMELAAELCDLYVSRALRADRRIQK
jgi:mannose-1-phosphate guanylyltransferase/phosphomannomutase